MKKYHSTILLVDKDEKYLAFAEIAFRQNGVKEAIHKVRSGAEAIAYMAGEGKYSDRKVYAYPTFVMLALKMPHGDGFAVLKHLKSKPECAIIPSVVMTDSTNPADIKKAYMLGASSYHVKPTSLVELRRHLKILHDYWMTCEVPEIDSDGRQLPI